MFKPFSAGKWLRLTATAFLAGALLYGGARTSGWTDLFSSTKTSATKTAGAAVEAAAPGDAGERFLSRAKPWLVHKLERAAAHRRKLIVLAALLSPLLLLWVWLSARFEFVWLNAVAENTADISGPFDAFRRQGNSLFRWRLLLSAASLLLLAGGIGWALRVIARVRLSGDDPSTGVWTAASVAAPLAGLAGALIVLWLLSWFIGHFVVPMMAADDLTFRPAFGRTIGAIRTRPGGVLVFLLVWACLRVAAEAVASLLTVIAVLALLAGAAVLFGVPYLLLVKGLVLKPLFIAVGVLLAAPFGACAIVLLLCVRLPFAAFFRSLSLTFLSSLTAER